MSFRDKIKYQYMKLLYELLDLSSIENELRNNKILSKQIYDPYNLKISDYLFLKNDVSLTKLNQKEIELLKKYFSKDINYINSNQNYLREEMNQFLIKNMYKILLPDTDSKFIGYGSISPNNMIPSDCICYYCHYIRYTEENYKLNDQAQKIICKVANYMQYELSKKKGIKLAVIPCDEVSNLENEIQKTY